MNLIIDQGNTGTKLAVFDNSKFLEKKSFGKEKRTEIDVWLTEFAKKNPENLNIIISSVVDDEVNLDQMNSDVILKLNSESPIPIINKYSSPETLGNDRLANAVAIWKMNKNKNSLVIDLGTCIKYDLMNANGEYLGGNISPGLFMRYNSLNADTDKLPTIQPENFEFNYGIDTKSSILNGVQQGIAHEINGFIDRYKEEFVELTIFMTGGDLIYFEKEIKNNIFADSELTLKGLNEILNYNVQNK